MIDIVITSDNEPYTIGKAIEAFLEQEINENYTIYVVAPDEETLSITEEYELMDKRVKKIVDPGKGKSFALNKILPKLNGRIIVLSDGDVFVGKDSLKNLIKPFEDEKVGSVTGRPKSIDSRKDIFGYWSHLLCDAGAHGA